MGVWFCVDIQGTFLCCETAHDLALTLWCNQIHIVRTRKHTETRKQIASEIALALFDVGILCISPNAQKETLRWPQERVTDCQ